MEQLIDLLLGYIVSNEKIYKEIQETISGDSSGITCDEIFLKYYETIPSEEMSLIYACLAKIFFDLKEDDLSKEIQEIAKTWDEIKVGSKSFRVPYVITTKEAKKDLLDTFKPVNFSGKLYKCLSLVIEEDDDKKFENDKEKEKYEKKIKKIKDIKDDSIYKYNDIDKLLNKIVGDKTKVPETAIGPKLYMARKGGGKSNCQILSKTAKLIYDKWKELYKDSNDDNFLDLFKMKYTVVKEGVKKETVTTKDIGVFFKAFLMGVDCSGYVNQVYAQWMLDQYTQRKLNSDEIQKKMIETIGPNKDKTKCRDNCMAIREEEYAGVNYSLHHVGYFFPINEIKQINKKIKEEKEKQGKKQNSTVGNTPKYINIWNRTKANVYKKATKIVDKKSVNETIDLITVNEAVKAKIKAGDLICFEYNDTGKKIGHFIIVEKTGINNHGQWYFCVTESTTEPKKSRIGSEIKTDAIDGVRHDQGYYTSIEEFIELRNSRYDFFWFCRPKAINEYYNSI